MPFAFSNGNGNRPQNKEIKQQVSLKVDPTTNCAEVKGRAEAKVADIESRIDALKRKKRALVKLTSACDGRGETSD